MQTINYSLYNLIKDSVNPKTGISSSKRVSLLISQFLFAFQIFADIIIHSIIMLFMKPLPSVEFYKIMAAVQGTALFLNALIILWNLGAIKNVDVAFAKVLQQQVIKPGEAPITEEAPTIVDTVEAENIEQVNAQEINQK